MIINKEIINGLIKRQYFLITKNEIEIDWILQHGEGRAERLEKNNWFLYFMVKE